MAEAKHRDLAELRREMDRLNERLLDLLEQRVSLASEIATEKRALALPIHDPDREGAEIAAARARAGILDPDARERILRVVLQETRRAQGEP